VLIALYFLIWQSFGYFYAPTAVLTAALVLLFRGILTLRQVAIAVALAMTFTLILYLVFQVAFGISFTR
jgi:uncharacterized membrane protein YGL010W